MTSDDPPTETATPSDDIEYFRDLSEILAAPLPLLAAGEVKGCQVLTGDLTAHWYPAGGALGARCHCGDDEAPGTE